MAHFALVSVLAALLLAPTASWAQTPEEKGLAIAQETDRRDLGFLNSEVDLMMVLRNRHGDTSGRELRIQTLEVPEISDGDKSIVIFDRPRDIEGTTLLSFTHIAEADDQWLFLPALKRVKRISSANKSGPFIGSEFAYEDLLSQEVAKYTYRWLRDEPCGDLQCFVMERYPVYENSGYTKQITWVDQDEYRVMKIEYHDRKDDLLKTLTFVDYQQYLGQYWRAQKLLMNNHQTGKSTDLLFGKYEFRVPLSEGDFRPGRLKSLR
jgi:hypothetical protein